MGYLEWRTCDHGAATICADEWMTMQSATPSRATDTPTIVTIGDSHSKFFGPPKYFAGRAGLRTPLRYTIEPNPISAASVAGFRPGVSTLDVKTKVHQALTGASMAILSFGQVDLELGLYYRRAVKGEEWEAEQYAAWLAEIYANFLDSLDLSGTRIAVKGVNLTALRPRQFAIRYISRIVTKDEGQTQAERNASVAPHMLSEPEQNRLHLSFNDKVRIAAEARGFGYFDLVRETSEEADTGSVTPRLGENFLTAAFDHHLADTIPVRRMHYEAAGKVFGIRTDDLRAAQPVSAGRGRRG